ncbi:TetR/AcrR family transcriptional regulator [Rhodococcus sp. NPDC060086]|uniref:TetR/AcrR family transcriptional regulator n=1 Tax=Rhodococcus sp. NPDC060086 TaxID=3347055 RepID=UPI003660474E
MSTDVVITEAGRLVDEEGTQALTLTALAQRFGVAQPSLYKHIGGLDDLHGRLAVVAARAIGAALRRAASGRSGALATAAVAAAYRDYAREHPGSYNYLLRPRPDDPEHAEAAQEIFDVLSDVLAGYGIDEEKALIDATRFLRSALHGFVALEIAHGFAMDRATDASFESLITAIDAALRAWPV